MQDDIIVPLGNLVVTDDGVMLQNITANNIDQFPTYRSGYNLVEYDTMSDPDLTVGGLYGGAQGWSECTNQSFNTTGAGLGAGYRAGVGTAGLGGTLGYGGGVGAGAGTEPGQNTLEFSLNALKGMDVYSPTGELVGEVDNLYQSQNAYVVMEIDTGWFSEGGTAVVPMQRFVWTGDGLNMPGVTEKMIENYDPYDGVYGNFWGGGYSTLDTGAYNTIGDIYGYDT